MYSLNMLLCQHSLLGDRRQNVSAQIHDVQRSIFKGVYFGTGSHLSESHEIASSNECEVFIWMVLIKSSFFEVKIKNRWFWKAQNKNARAKRKGGKNWGRETDSRSHWLINARARCFWRLIGFFFKLDHKKGFSESKYWSCCSFWCKFQKTYF